MRRLTASATSRAKECVASLILPGEDTTSEAATRGTAIHAYLAAVLEGADRDTLLVTEVPSEYRDDCAAIDIDAIKGLCGDDPYEPELAIMYDPATDLAEKIGCNIGRNYPDAPPHVIFGTADLVVYGSVPAVYDFKTGQATESAATNAQLRTLALMVSLITGAEAVRAGIIYLKDDGAIWLDECVYGPGDLDSWGEALSDTIDLTMRSEQIHASGIAITTNPGDHCRYCPARQDCHGRRDMAQKNESLVTLTATSAVLALPPKERGDLYARALELENYLADMIKAIRASAATDPLPLPNGKILREVPGAERLDGDIAYAAILSQFGPDVADKASKVSVTKASLKKALGGDTDKALAAIRDAGGVKQGEPMIKEVKAS